MAAAHQTVRLARGRHRAPAGAVCAMELSSMLARERFSDHPSSVCPVVAAFLRGYNDAVGDELRQTLFGIAAAVVDSRSDDPVLRDDRGRALVGWSVGLWEERRWRLPWPPVFEPGLGFAEVQAAGEYAARRARRDRCVHERTLVFVEALVRGSTAPEPAREGAPTAPLVEPVG